MKSTLALLALSTALGAFMTAPVAARGVAFEWGQSGPGLSAPDLTAADLLLFADNDSDDDEGDDDDDEGEGEDDDEGEDDEGCGDDDGGDDDDDGQPCTDAPNPAPMGKKSPPKNGLFGNGAAPKAKVN